MKLSSTLLFAATAQAAALQSRQLPEILAALAPHGAHGKPDMAELLKKLSPNGVGSVPPALLDMAPLLPRATVHTRVAGTSTFRQGSKRTTVTYGPYVMVGKGKAKPFGSFSLDPNGQSFVSVVDKGLCVDDCTILSSTTNLVFKDGSIAGPDQGVYQHHLLLSDTSKKVKVPVMGCDQDTIDVLKLPIGQMNPAAPFVSQGEDNGKSPTYYTSVDGSYDSGFHLKKGYSMMMQADLVNYNAEQKEVYVSIDIEYLDGIHGSDAASNLMTVVGCKFAQPNLNATGIAVTESKLFPILANTTIVAAKGHMHNGGTKMVLRVNGKDVCDSVPNYIGESIHGMSVCNLNIKVQPGDSISMDSVYDLATHPLRKGVDGMEEHDVFGGADVMGMYILTFAYN